MPVHLVRQIHVRQFHAWTFWWSTIFMSLIFSAPMCAFRRRDSVDENCVGDNKAIDVKNVPRKNTRNPAVARVGRPYRLCYSQRPTRKKRDFSHWLQSHTRYGDAAILNATNNAKIRYGISAHVRAVQKLCIEKLLRPNRCR